MSSAALGCAVIAIIAGGLVSEAFFSLMRLYAVDVPEHELMPRRWVAWGHQGSVPYFFLRLPSWSWEMHWEAGPDEWHWMQRVVFYRGSEWGMCFFRPLP